MGPEDLETGRGGIRETQFRGQNRLLYRFKEFWCAMVDLPRYIGKISGEYLPFVKETSAYLILSLLRRVD